MERKDECLPQQRVLRNFRQQRLCVSRVDAERLFADNGTSGRDCSGRPYGVFAVGQGDVHGIHVVAGQRARVIGGVRYLVGVGPRSRAGRVATSDHDRTSSGGSHRG